MINRRGGKLCGIALLLAILLTVAGSLPLFAAEGASSAGESATAYATVRVEALAQGILSRAESMAGAESIQAWIDTDLASGAGVTAEWYVLALRQYGEYDFSAYEAALCAYLAQNTVYSASTRLKYGLCLAAAGSESDRIADLLDTSVGQQGIMSYVYALHLQNNRISSSVMTAEEVREKLLSLQLSDGGWALTGAVSDIDVTAMTLQALAAHSESDPAVRTAVERAVELLSERQEADGGYASYGTSNAESASQVMIALSALGIDCLSDERFVKDGNTVLDAIERYRLPDDGFAHTVGGVYNETATQQALMAMIAYLRMAAGKSGLYLLGEPLYFSQEESGEESGGAENLPAQTLLQTSQTENPLENAPDGVSDSASAGAALTDTPQFAGYKLWGTIGILALGGIACLILWLTRRRNFKNFLAVGAIALFAIVLLMVTDLQSAEEYYGNAPEIEAPIGKITFTIRCDTVAGETDAKHIPADGVILPIVELEIEEGDTVYDCLDRAARLYSIQYENNGSQAMPYIAGIANLYEFDFGDLSGWTYRVNGESPSVGCGEYRLSDGDCVEWLYTCDLGNDLD